MNDKTEKMAGERSAAGWRSILVNTLKMLLILLAAIILSELLRGWDVSTTSLIMVYLLSVVVISYSTPTYVYGIVSALISALAYDYLITDPRMRFSFDTGSPITLVIMLAVTFIISTLTAQSKEQARLATNREHRAQLMREINQELLAVRDVHTIVRLANEYLMGHLHRPVVFYTADPTVSEEEIRVDAPDGADAGIFYAEAERKRVHRIFKNGAAEAENPFDDIRTEVTYLPLESSRGKMLGVIGIACQPEELTSFSKTFVQMLTGQVTLALELQLLSDERNETLVEAEREKIRSTLLRSISHDLRTPLTSILGASTAILDQKITDWPALESLTKDIQDNAGWLIRMVENILVITRISGDNLKVKKTMEAAEEVVTQAADIVRKRFPDYFIHVHIPSELLIVPMDATLISQVIINLLENAVKNSEPDSLIFLNLERKGDFAQFTVNDKGKGIPEQLLDNLFSVHSPQTEEVVDASRGVGIGLSICKTIVQAHGGTIEGKNRDGGASFFFKLPLHPEDRGEIAAAAKTAGDPAGGDADG